MDAPQVPLYKNDAQNKQSAGIDSKSNLSPTKQPPKKDLTPSSSIDPQKAKAKTGLILKVTSPKGSMDDIKPSQREAPGKSSVHNPAPEDTNHLSSQKIKNIFDTQIDVDGDLQLKSSSKSSQRGSILFDDDVEKIFGEQDIRVKQTIRKAHQDGVTWIEVIEA